jgi:prepilin-type N-terminal cleavage/methylation domain-containing protein/prepilin-type processing-associated H-X9-DG protein
MTHTSGHRGFTLIEVLVSISIIGVLISVVLPMAGKTVASARGFKCEMGQRAVAYDFAVFGDDLLHGNRGEDEDLPGRGLFRLETFQESQYGVDEFWAWPGETTHQLPDRDGNDPLRCPEVRGRLTLRSNMPCTSGAIAPAANVSFGFNVRLHVSERPGGGFRFVHLTSAVLQESGVPLMWDVDGASAAATGHGDVPFFSGPPLDSPTLFAGNRYWHPALRHNGAMKVAFVDGHVGSSRRPLEEAGWRWGWVPGR